MYRGDVQPVLRCSQCNKPFDKESTLKRHGYYCRSRKAGGTTRSRSCSSCARAKARCDNRRPQCSRCITKATGCHYPPNTPKDTSALQMIQQIDDDAQTDQWNLLPSPSVENQQEANNDSGSITPRTLVIPELGFASNGAEYLDWDDPDIGLVDFLNSRTHDEIVQYPSSRSSSFLLHSTPRTGQTVQVQLATSPLNVSIPRLPTSTLRIIQRPKMKTGPQRIANLILHTLKSYPLMMLRQNTLPPFIHPQLISSNAGNIHMEPLTNCISLIHMISGGVQGSRKLFWKNVRLECERLRGENLMLDKWELLAAMQALSIYILIRLDEGETDHNNYDSLLLATVAIIAKQLTRCGVTCNMESALCNYDLKTSWKDWIYEESRRRLSVVYRVLNMLVYFEPAAMCDLQTDLVLAPLPSKKQLWEAGDEFIWKLESEKEPGPQTAFGLAANGELVKLDEGQLYCSDAVLLYKPVGIRTPSSSPASWEEWCSGMDGFGGLVILAASLIV